MIARIAALAIPALGVTVACTPAGPTVDRGLDHALEARIDEYVATYVAQGNFSGSIHVSRAGDVIAERAYGLSSASPRTANEPGTRHHIASLSKSLTAVAIMQLVDSGRLELDEPISRLVPELPGADRLTPHHLLTHTSGIPDINRFPGYRSLAREPQTPEALTRVIAKHAGGAGPTETYAYSNSNYNVLALIVERVTGKKFGDYLAHGVFEPLGMSSTAHAGSEREAYLPPPAEGHLPVGINGTEPAPVIDWTVKTGNGSLVSTGGDLSRFLHAVAGGLVLSDSSRRRMLTPHVGERIGYGWFIGRHLDRDVYYYNGNSPGVSAYFAVYPNEDIAVVVLANHDIPLATSIGRTVGAIVFGYEYDPPVDVRPVPLPSPAAALEYVGTYEFAPGWGFDIRLEHGELLGRIAWPRYPATLIPLGNDRFFHRYYWDSLVFTRDPAGRVDGLHWESSPGSIAPRADAD